MCGKWNKLQIREKYGRNSDKLKTMNITNKFGDKLQIISL